MPVCVEKRYVHAIQSPKNFKFLNFTKKRSNTRRPGLAFHPNDSWEIKT